MLLLCRSSSHAEGNPRARWEEADGQVPSSGHVRRTGRSGTFHASCLRPSHAYQRAARLLGADVVTQHRMRTVTDASLECVVSVLSPQSVPLRNEQLFVSGDVVPGLSEARMRVPLDVPSSLYGRVRALVNVCGRTVRGRVVCDAQLACSATTASHYFSAQHAGGVRRATCSPPRATSSVGIEQCSVNLLLQEMKLEHSAVHHSTCFCGMRGACADVTHDPVICKAFLKAAAPLVS
eukprot:6211168-Pleurochrysis_carterae.AAC.2